MRTRGCNNFSHPFHPLPAFSLLSSVSLRGTVDGPSLKAGPSAALSKPPRHALSRQVVASLVYDKMEISTNDPNTPCCWRSFDFFPKAVQLSGHQGCRVTHLTLTTQSFGPKKHMVRIRSQG